MYEKALAARPPTGIDHRWYELMVTNVHRDMTIVYEELGNLSRAREYAQRVLGNSADGNIVKSRDHLRLGRILLEMGEYAEAQHQATSGIESFDDPKNSEEYCAIVFLSIYQRRDYLHYFRQAEPFPELEDVVARLETLHGLNPEDAQTLFLLAASSACLKLTDCHWQPVLQGRTLPDEVIKYFKMYGDLPDNADDCRGLSRCTRESAFSAARCHQVAVTTSRRSAKNL